MTMRGSSARFFLVAVIAFCIFSLPGCDRFGSKLTLANYNKISTGMSKVQVEKILGAPTNVETTDMIIFKKTSYRYERGKDFAMITFKNDEVDSKDTNLSP
jgi:hypothetical protein